MYVFDYPYDFNMCIAEGEYAGVGSANPYKSGFIKGFTITEREIDDLVAFLQSLTDQEFITNPAYSDPHLSQ